jgi:SAM-dependent methyltransferase
MELSFDDFRNRALDKDLSKWEKIGFPDGYRKGIERSIFEDISSKTNLVSARLVLDIGCGCSELVEQIITFSQNSQKQLYLIDSIEMLNNIDAKYLDCNIHFVPGRFPDKEVVMKIAEASFDVIIVYSVIQYAFISQSVYGFIHECIKLLKPGGRLLIGDIPNYQARERFLDSEEGREFLSKAPQHNNTINLHHENLERIDDSVIMSLLFRFRNFGCETYLLPQPEALPFANRREDILIIKR